MDRKSIIGLVASIALLLLWFPVVNRLYPPKPLPPGSTNNVAAVQAPGTNGTASNVVQRTPPVLQPADAAPRAPQVASNQPEQVVVLSSSNANYTITSRGGGIKLIELVEFPEVIERKKSAQQNVKHTTLNANAAYPAMALLGGPAIEGDGVYELSRTSDGVRATKQLTNGLVITKDFRLSSNYLLAVKVRLENRTAAPLAVPPHEWVVGTATPMNAHDKGQAVGAQYFTGKDRRTVDGAAYFSKTKFMCFPRVPPPEYRSTDTNIVWAAANNQFFALIAMPDTPAQGLIVRRMDLPATLTPQGMPNPVLPQGYETTMVYPGLTIAPQQAIEHSLHIFSGPKEFQRLATLGDHFKNQVGLVMGYGGFFGFFAKGLLLAMNWLHETAWLSYGWAIVVITIIIKLLFWPLTQASTRSMKRLQAMQPQMNAIKEKYKDDPAKMNRKTMEFMRENKVNPMGGCLPMVIQIPVFIGFFQMIQSAIELRGAQFLWVTDLSSPDTLFMIPGTGFPFNLLPLIMGVTMFWQARLTPPSPGMDPTQAKMMRYMPMIFMVFLYNFSAGLTLYWTVQNLLTILQTKLTKTTTPATATAAPVLTSAPKKKK
jgi:YidC/Oxa1 family membrane protein insertase